MTSPSAAPTAVVTGVTTGAIVSIFGAGGPSGAFLGTLGLMALGGAWARLFWDATTATYSLRRQLGFVGISVATSFVMALVLWETSGDYPAFLMGIATLTALVGPTDALRLLRGVLARALGVGSQDGKGGG